MVYESFKVNQAEEVVEEDWVMTFWYEYERRQTASSVRRKLSRIRNENKCKNGISATNFCIFSLNKT